MGKLQYRTKQMTELLTFLESVKGRHVTVNEICDALAQKGIAIGTTTVYRHLERLVPGDVVHRQFAQTFVARAVARERTGNGFFLARQFHRRRLDHRAQFRGDQERGGHRFDFTYRHRLSVPAAVLYQRSAARIGERIKKSGGTR